LSYGLDITIVGDNDFYSQRAQVIPCPRASVMHSLMYVIIEHATHNS